MRFINLSLACLALFFSLVVTSCKKSDEVVKLAVHANKINISAVSQPVLTWAKQISGKGQLTSLKLQLAGEGKTNVAGIFKGTFDFDPGAGEFTMTRTNGYDKFTVQLDALGNFVNAVRDDDRHGIIHGSEYTGKRIRDKNGNTYVVYYLRSATDLDPGPGVYYLTYKGKQDLLSFYWGYGSYVQKLDKTGKLLGAKLNGGIAYGYSYSSIAVDDAGNMYVTGYGPGMTGTEETFFLQKINPAGPTGLGKKKIANGFVRIDNRQ